MAQSNKGKSQTKGSQSSKSAPGKMGSQDSQRQGQPQSSPQDKKSASSKRR